MSASFDYLAVPLTCPNCGAHHPAASSLEIDCQTKVRAQPYLDALVLGERYELLSPI